MKRLRFWGQEGCLPQSHAGSTGQVCWKTSLVFTPVSQDCGSTCILKIGPGHCCKERPANPAQTCAGPCLAMQAQSLPHHFPLCCFGVPSCGLAPSLIGPGAQRPSLWGCWVPGTPSLPRPAPVWLPSWLWTEPTRTPH